MEESNHPKEPSKLKNEVSSTSPEPASKISTPRCCETGCVSSSRKGCTHESRNPQRRSALSEGVAHDSRKHGKWPASSEGSVHESRKRSAVSEEYARDSWKRHKGSAHTSNLVPRPINPVQTRSSKVGDLTSKANVNPDSLNPEMGHGDGFNPGGQLASGDTTESDEEARQILKAKGEEETDPEAIGAAWTLMVMNFEDIPR